MSAWRAKKTSKEKTEPWNFDFAKKMSTASPSPLSQDTCQQNPITTL